MSRPEHDDVVAYLEANPAAMTGDVARIFGVKPCYVSSVRWRRKLRRQVPRYATGLLPDNHDWVLEESRSLGVTPQEFINAIVTDARFEGQ